MPTSVKITKELILNAAFDIARERGIDGVSNREIAKKLNCSIRPIYYQFKNTDELKMELCNKIEKYFYSFLFGNIVPDVPEYKQIGINYIRFAKEEQNLFRLLFMSDSDYFMNSFIDRDEKDFSELNKIIKLSTKLSDEEIESFHVLMWVFTQGIASLVASGSVKFTDKQVRDMLSYQFQALMLLKENPNNKWIIKGNNFKEENNND